VRLRYTHLVVSILIVLMLSACLVRAQEEPAKLLTLEEAVSLARSHNRELKQAGLEIHKQKEAFGEAKTQLYPRFGTYVLASELLTPLDFTIKSGTFGTFPATGPIPAKDSIIHTPARPVAIASVTATQPLTQLRRINLSIKEQKLGVDLRQQSYFEREQELVDEVRRAYYAMLQSQSELESHRALLAYLEELQQLTGRRLQQEAFQPFNRLGQESRAGEGTGIGLVMSKRVVELMEGAIGVESTVGVRSVFWIELLLTTAPTFLVASSESTTAIQARIPTAARLRTLLYVEDNPANLTLVEQLIARRSDIRLLTAVNGTLGIEIARASQPEVILMDINLPGISGIEALKILREDPATAHIPVVALSANAMQRDTKKGMEAGFFYYLTKPIKVNEFMDALDGALEFAEKNSARN
jgi:CheY-like chemotaxis protein